MIDRERDQAELDEILCRNRRTGRRRRRLRKGRVNTAFVMVPMAWVERLASQRSGAAWVIAIRLLHLDWKSAGRPVVLGNVALRELGIDRRRKSAWVSDPRTAWAHFGGASSPSLPPCHPPQVAQSVSQPYMPCLTNHTCPVSRTVHTCPVLFFSLSCCSLSDCSLNQFRMGREFRIGVFECSNDRQHRSANVDLGRDVARVGSYGFFVSRPRRNPHASSPRGWRDWYQLQIWRNIRAVHLRKEPLCRECLARGEHALASEVDHITPHDGDWNQFILGAKQSLCVACHRGKSARAHRKSQGFDEYGYAARSGAPWNRRR